MVVVAQLPFKQAHPMQLAPGLRELLTRGTVHHVRVQRIGVVGQPRTVARTGWQPSLSVECGRGDATRIAQG